MRPVRSLIRSLSTECSWKCPITHIHNSLVLFSYLSMFQCLSRSRFAFKDLSIVIRDTTIWPVYVLALTLCSIMHNLVSIIRDIVTALSVFVSYVGEAGEVTAREFVFGDLKLEIRSILLNRM